MGELKLKPPLVISAATSDSKSTAVSRNAEEHVETAKGPLVVAISSATPEFASSI